MTFTKLQDVSRLTTYLKSHFGLSLFIVLLICLVSGGVFAADSATAAAKEASGPIAFLFAYVANNPFVFLF